MGKMKSLKGTFTLEMAVEEELNRGISTLDNLKDKKGSENDISILINRKAFVVLFPDLASDVNSVTPNVEELKNKFFELAFQSRSVIFARALPAMKKKVVVEMNQRNPSLISLAVGDGANDTDMILAANVGIGIAGVEGTAAVNSSDYALPQFRHLHDLLFVHGFWSYHRISILVNFLCYKSLICVIPLVCYGVVSRYTPLRRYDYWSQTLVNPLYTSFPVMVVAIFDEILPREIISNETYLYSTQKNRKFSKRIFMLWLGRAVFHGLIVWLLTLYALSFNNISPSGHTHGQSYFSLAMFIALNMIIIITGCFDINLWTRYNTLAIMISFFSLSIITPFLSFVHSKYETYGIIQKLSSSPKDCFVIILTIAIPALLELSVRSFYAFNQASHVLMRRQEILCGKVYALNHKQPEPVIEPIERPFREPFNYLYRWLRYGDVEDDTPFRSPNDSRTTNDSRTINDSKTIND